MRIVTILGARPQFVKAASLSRFIESQQDITEIIVHTGQHYDNNMSDIFFEEMSIPKPDYYLGVNGTTHGRMTGRMMAEIDEVLEKEQPDVVVVYGDTNSTLAGALSAKKMGIPVVHVEAGLRSFNMKMPEEVNRILTDRISDILFCPTESASRNLLNEGYGHIDAEIVLSGDIMYDSALYYSKVSARQSTLDIGSFGSAERGFILVTIHRAENTDDPEKLRNIFETLEEINKSHNIVLPLHPRTRAKLRNIGLNPSFDILDPVGYFDMLELLKGCDLVMTDSGGLQKEAYFFKKPCITLREETEWVELVNHKVNTLVGSDPNLIRLAYQQTISSDFDFDRPLYGEGNTSEIIYTALLKFGKK